eukprot:TRINITY_DN14557_c0_g1_i1.p1 TRINITY_DN14557_c0_g1~~TRINITY_DN14557_c0_g1_i1.p1  ORF type:complete len:106 (-),score=20.20 TRINITY_DN14557_c0_g1_i1:245-562(-)
MATRSRSILAVAAVLAVLAFVGCRTAFVPPAGVAAEKQQLTLQENSQGTVVLGASASFLAAAPQPAHALLLQDEILPISFAVIGATLWGIVLGFVLLRLQEAFPE